MAKINESAFRNWEDGTVMKAADYKQEREIIRVAINDNHDRRIKSFDLQDSTGTLKSKYIIPAIMDAFKFREGTNASLSLDPVTGVFTVDVKMSALDSRYYTKTQIDATLSVFADQIIAIQNKLDTIEVGANKYTHPVNHPASIITQDTNNRFVSDTEKAKWNNIDNKVDKVTGKQLSTEDYTAGDKNKLANIAANAEVNQNAFSTVNDISADNKQDVVTIAGGTGITVTTNTSDKTLTITATGEATPGAHGSSHGVGGADEITELVILKKVSDGYKTSVVPQSADPERRWTKIATVELPNDGAYAHGMLNVAGSPMGSYGTGVGRMAFEVYRENSSDVSVQLQIDQSWLDPDEVAAVINTGGDTVDIYFELYSNVDSYGYDIRFSPAIIRKSADAAVNWFENQPLLSTLPAGVGQEFATYFEFNASEFWADDANVGVLTVDGEAHVGGSLQVQENLDVDEESSFYGNVHFFNNTIFEDRAEFFNGADFSAGVTMQYVPINVHYVQEQYKELTPDTSGIIKTDYDDGSVLYVKLTRNVTVDTSIPLDFNSRWRTSVTLVVEQTGSYGITWGSNIRWNNDEAPEAPENGKVGIYTFIRWKSNLWYGFDAGSNFASV